MGRASTYIGVTLKTIFLIALVILSGFFALKYAQEYIASDEWKYTLVVFGSLAISIIIPIVLISRWIRPVPINMVLLGVKSFVWKVIILWVPLSLRK